MPLALGLLIGLAGGAPGQTIALRGYYLHVASGSWDSPFSPGGIGDLQRARLMSTPRFRSVRLDLAYEHALRYTSQSALGGLIGEVGGLGTGTDWLGLQGTLEEGEHLRWSHRVDRLAVTFSAADVVQITAGRQAISWATTLFLTPADPFAPFDPVEPFREYRPGVDALRVQAFPGSFSEVELVVRPVETPRENTVTVLARGRTVWRGFEVGLWAGSLHDEASAGLAATATLAGAAIRGEGTVRRSEGRTVVRLAAGLDRRFPLAGRDLYVVLEYQRDGFGAADPDDLLQVLLSAPFARRELQVLGRDVAAGQVTYQAHPLIAAGVLTLVNLNDPSMLAAPSISYSVSNEVTARAGLFIGFGADVTGLGLPASEYGTVPTTLYLSATAFF